MNAWSQQSADAAVSAADDDDALLRLCLFLRAGCVGDVKKCNCKWTVIHLGSDMQPEDNHEEMKVFALYIVCSACVNEYPDRPTL